MTRVPASWLALREPADHEARRRAEALLRPLEAVLDHGRPVRVVDVGAGTGSNLRWVAPRLPGPQEWVLVDHDPDLLPRAVDLSRGLTDREGSPVRVRTRTADLTHPKALAVPHGALLTASALLDVLTEATVKSLVAAASRERASVLFSLTVAGTAELEPADPLDDDIAAAFAAHQRRDAAQGRLCGGSGTAVAAAALRREGYVVHLAETPWTLGAANRRLLVAWLRGWLGAAVEQEPRLIPQLDRWRSRRAAEMSAGTLRARVGHLDLVAVPASATVNVPGGRAVGEASQPDRTR